MYSEPARGLCKVLNPAFGHSYKICLLESLQTTSYILVTPLNLTRDPHGSNDFKNFLQATNAKVRTQQNAVQIEQS